MPKQERGVRWLITLGTTEALGPVCLSGNWTRDQRSLGNTWGAWRLENTAMEYEVPERCQMVDAIFYLWKAALPWLWRVNIWEGVRWNCVAWLLKIKRASQCHVQGHVHNSKKHFHFFVYTSLHRRPPPLHRRDSRNKSGTPAAFRVGNFIIFFVCLRQIFSILAHIYLNSAQPCCFYAYIVLIYICIVQCVATYVYILCFQRHKCGTTLFATGCTWSQPWVPTLTSYRYLAVNS